MTSNFARHVGYGVVPGGCTRYPIIDGEMINQICYNFTVVPLYYYRGRASNTMPNIVTVSSWARAYAIKEILEAAADEPEGPWVTF